MITSRAVAGSKPPTRVRWGVLGYLVAASFVAYLLRSNLSIAGGARLQIFDDGWQFARAMAVSR